MTKPGEELSQAEFEGLMERVQEAAAYALALSAADLPWLLHALLMLAQLQARLAAQDSTLQKLRKRAGIGKSSEPLKHLAPGSAAPKRERQPAPPSAKPPPQAVLHERCQPGLAGLAQGQLWPDCGRGTLYKYAPAGCVTDQRSNAAQAHPAHAGAATRRTSPPSCPTRSSRMAPRSSPAVIAPGR